MLPQTYEEWKDCIVNACRIKLTKDFAKARLEVYKNINHPETKSFSKLYGQRHLDNIKYWYSKVLAE